MNDTSIIIALLAAFGAGALVAIVVMLRRHDPVGDILSFDKNTDLRHFESPRSAQPLMVVAVILFAVGITSWATERDRAAKREERLAAARHAPLPAKPAPPLKISINRFNIVEVETGKCYGTANVAKRRTFQSCAD